MTTNEFRIFASALLTCAFLCVIFVTLEDGEKTRKLIREQAAMVEVHYLIPDDSACAVKMMFFRSDSTTDLFPVVRQVCHWDHSK